jgi:hydrogenase maturation protease
MTRTSGGGDPVRLIVCGNVDRGDDGAGPAAVSAMLPTLPRPMRARLDVRLANELRAEDLVELPPGGACVIVDAVAGIDPGRIIRLPLHELAAQPGLSPRSSHQLPIHLALGLAGILRGRPVDGMFVGIGGLAFGYGASLSSAVGPAIAAFGEAIGCELEAMLRTLGPVPAAHEGQA